MVGRGAGPARLNVAFSGLSAAGKTTHARILAGQLGYEYVSGTEVFMDILGMDRSAARGVWFTHLEEILALPDRDGLDDELDRRLVQIAENNDGLVLDTWGLPWICDAVMVRLWIASDHRSRVWKCFVSQQDCDEVDLTLADCRRLLDRKDRQCRDMFLRRHGFDLFQPGTVFDAVVDNSTLIDAPTRAAADAGIAAFTPTVLRACADALGCHQRAGARR